MGRNFKFRFSKLISAFQFCRMKSPSNLPMDPVPSSYCRSSLKRQVSSTLTSVDRVMDTKPSSPCSSRDRSPPETSNWQNDEKWHVSERLSFSITDSTPDETPRHKIYNSSASAASNDELFPHLKAKKSRARKKKMTAHKDRNSASSAESWFLSGDERILSEEKESLICSSRSFSIESSSELDSQLLEIVRESGKCRKKKAGKPRRKVKMMTCQSSESLTEGESPARLSLFKRLVPCSVEGKVKESFAVLKKSKEPYEDFKRSMVEMILEKRMFEEKELEELLQCFLSLNSRVYHGLIVEAFTEIWETMFCRYSTDD